MTKQRKAWPRVLAVVCLLIVVGIGVWHFKKYCVGTEGNINNCEVHTLVANSGNLAYGIPSWPDHIIERQGYAIGYDVQHHQARWVSYSLSRGKMLTRLHGKRTNDFRPDPVLGADSPSLADYRRSGYDRGHLCPAADQSWSMKTMSESFYMSNMSPQVGMFNRGIWRELEEWVREQAVVNTNIFIYTGPIFTRNFMRAPIGEHRITVPGAYYKVILDETEPRKMIGFILNNEPSTNALITFVCTVDAVEKATNLNFFRDMPKKLQDRLESECDPASWGLQ